MALAFKPKLFKGFLRSCGLTNLPRVQHISQHNPNNHDLGYSREKGIHRSHREHGQPGTWKKIQQQPKPLRRRVFEEVVAPIYPWDLDQSWKKINRCRVALGDAEIKGQEVRNLYKEFLLRRCKEMFEDNQMLIVYQMLSIPRHEQRGQALHFRREGFQLHKYPHEVISECVRDTKYRNMLVLVPEDYDSNVYITSPEIRLPDLMKANKHLTDYIMLGGIIGDRICRRADIEALAKLPPQDVLLGETVSLLGHGAQNLHASLNSHQQTLSANLTQYIKDQTGDKAPEEGS